MINEENQLNLSKIAYSKQKTQILQEFEEIKKEVENVNRIMLAIMQSENILLFLIY